MLYEVITILKKAIAQVKEHYDYVIIDSPPALGPMTINALSASNRNNFV